LTNDESDAQEQSCSEVRRSSQSLMSNFLQLRATHNAQRTTLTHTSKMEPAQSTTLPKATSTSSAAVSNFRLGEDDPSDVSDSDQSAHSERSLSPSGVKKSKAKKKKERKQVGALTDELGILLGAAFQTSNADSDVPAGKRSARRQEDGRMQASIYSSHGPWDSTRDQ
jgi:hypothetical protein